MTVVLPPRVECHLALTWLHAGAVVVAEDGRLVFPEVGRAPGLYQITINFNGIREVYTAKPPTSDVGFRTTARQGRRSRPASA